MTTILDNIKGINAYPIPMRAIKEIAVRRGLELEVDALNETLTSREYNLAVADVLLWLSFAPNVSQGGQSYSFTDEQRADFRSRANQLYKHFGDDGGANGALKAEYGYKGSRL